MKLFIEILLYFGFDQIGSILFHSIPQIVVSQLSDFLLPRKLYIFSGSHTFNSFFLMRLFFWLSFSYSFDQMQKLWFCQFTSRKGLQADDLLVDSTLRVFKALSQLFYAQISDWHFDLLPQCLLLSLQTNLIWYVSTAALTVRRLEYFIAKRVHLKQFCGFECANIFVEFL